MDDKFYRNLIFYPLNYGDNGAANIEFVWDYVATKSQLHR